MPSYTRICIVAVTAKSLEINKIKRSNPQLETKKPLLEEGPTTLGIRKDSFPKFGIYIFFRFYFNIRRNKIFSTNFYFTIFGHLVRLEHTIHVEAIVKRDGVQHLSNNVKKGEAPNLYCYPIFCCRTRNGFGKIVKT